MEAPSRSTSRRALLAAAAGGAAALAGQAAAPLAALASGEPAVLGVDNVSDAQTSIHRSNGGDVLASSVTVMGPGSAMVAWSSIEAGVFAASSGTSPRPRSDTTATGVYGYAPAQLDPIVGTGVWGDGDDIGVLGTGGVGVLGDGNVGVEGDGAGANGVGVLGFATEASVAGVVGVAEVPNTIGVHALSPRGAVDRTALRVTGKAIFSRSGRAAIAAGASSKVVYLAGVGASSLIFAVLASSRPGRWVRAVVPSTGKFTIYLNTSVTTSTAVVWFVLN